MFEYVLDLIKIRDNESVPQIKISSGNASVEDQNTILFHARPYI